MKKHIKRTAEAAWALWGSLSLGAILIIVAVGAVTSIYGLRSNNLTMVELRNDVFIADKEDGDIEGALVDLRAHVISHMNTDLNRDSAFAIEGEKPIQLVNKYYRDAVTGYQEALVGNPAYIATLTAAQTVCESPQVPASERLSCIGGQISATASPTFPSLEPPSKDLYVFDFESPRWSPDIAGFGIVLFAAGIVMLAARFIVGAVVSRMIYSKN